MTTPAPWFHWFNQIDGIWRIDHKLTDGQPKNYEIVGFVGKEDNARLVAAAPELLHALMALCQAVGDHPDSMHTDGSLHQPFINAAQTIRKATPPPQPLRDVTEHQCDISPKGRA